MIKSLVCLAVSFGIVSVLELSGFVAIGVSLAGWIGLTFLVSMSGK